MLRRILALLALAALVMAPPILLLAWGSTDVGAITLWRLSDVRVLVWMLTIVGWLAWYGWLIGLGIEITAAVRGRPLTLRLPGLGWSRTLASGLLAAVMGAGAVGSLVASAPLAVAAPIVDAPAAQVSAADPGAEPFVGTSADGRADAGDVGRGTGSESAIDPEGEVRTHTVATGDDLWSLAERYYGDGARWRVIVDANPSLQDDPTARLVAGEALRVPVVASQVVVEPGDTLSGLADEHLGDPDRWPEIHALNADRVADPDLIHPGWVLSLPVAVGDAGEAAAGEEDRVEEADAADAESDAAAPAPPQADEAPAPPQADEADALASDEGAADTLGPDADIAPALGLLGGLSAMTAGAILTGLGVRHRRQEASRPLGRRYVQPTAATSRYGTALTRLAPAHGRPDRMVLLARAMRILARHWWEHASAAPPVERVLVGSDGVEFCYASAPDHIPDGFVGLGGSIAATWDALAACADVDHPVAYPGLVTLGETSPGETIMVDVVTHGFLGVRDEAGAAPEVLSALLVELACSPWSDEVDLLVVTEDPAFADAAGEGRILIEPSPDRAVAAVERVVRQRSRFMRERPWAVARLDPDLAEAWSAHIVLFEIAPDAAQAARLDEVIAAHPCGVAAIAVVAEDVDARAGWALAADAVDVHVTTPDVGDVVVPQTVPSGTRRALTDLHRQVTRQDATPAPWWHEPSKDAMFVIALHPQAAPTVRSGPRVLLLGPIDLTGCAGTPPTRALRQCVEYCTWLLLHPGSTPQEMVRALLVAEGTRRSNMSRLRSWLGADPDGELYLPEAYSGRIALHEEVTSDWDEFSLLLAGGVNRQPLERLVAALELVRGAPLADAAPGQWGWAEGFRSDACALIRDAGVVASRMARERGDVEVARWAIQRALSAAPEDELLLVELLRVEQACGHRDDVHRLVQRVTRNARILGMDLLPETIDACQDAVEGRLRARA